MPALLVDTRLAGMHGGHEGFSVTICNGARMWQA